MIRLVGRAEEIINTIKDEPKQLYTLLCHSNYQESPFYSRPILQYIPSQDRPGAGGRRAIRHDHAVANNRVTQTTGFQ